MNKLLIATLVVASSSVLADPPQNQGNPNAVCISCVTSQIGGSAIGEVAAVSKSALEGLGDTKGFAANIGIGAVDLSVKGAVDLGSVQMDVKGAAESANESLVDAKNATKASADGTGIGVGLGGVTGQAATKDIVLPALPALPELPALQ